jgi:hypothetical protein
MTKAQKENRERFKKVQAEAKKLRKKNPKLTHIEAVKQAWAIDYSKKKKPAKKKIAEIGKAKKSAPKKKAAPKKKTSTKKTVSTHKDTKSHNVNIRVMSGINKMVGYLRREYIAVFHLPNGTAENEIFTATSLKEAKGAANMYKRREGIKGRVTVHLIKKRSF